MLEYNLKRHYNKIILYRVHVDPYTRRRWIWKINFSITIDGETKVFHDKTKFTQYLSMNPALQRVIKGKLQDKEGNYTLEKARK